MKFDNPSLEAGDPAAARIWEAIGTYLGYALGLYAEFYELKHVLILGRVIASFADPRGRHPASAFVIGVTEPILAPVRRLLPSKVLAMAPPEMKVRRPALPQYYP